MRRSTSNSNISDVRSQRSSNVSYSGRKKTRQKDRETVKEDSSHGESISSKSEGIPSEAEEKIKLEKVRIKPSAKDRKIMKNLLTVHHENLPDDLCSPYLSSSAPRELDGSFLTNKPQPVPVI